MIDTKFGKDAVTLVIEDNEVLLKYEEIHGIAEAYVKFYLRESIESHLKKKERGDLTKHMDEIINIMYGEIKYMFDDSQTIAAAILEATGEAL